jgi:chaperonin cofactor prefoldin
LKEFNSIDPIVQSNLKGYDLGENIMSLSISLKDFNNIIISGNALNVYSKNIDSMQVLSETEFNKLEAKIKDVYGNYTNYKQQVISGFNVTKNAIKTKLSEYKSVMDDLNSLSQIDKNNWKAEIQEKIDSIKDSI